MSTWSEAPARSQVLRGTAAVTARAARLDSDLRTSPFASASGVDARLTDPYLQDVVAAAARDAVERGRAEGRAAGYAAGLVQAAAEAQVSAAEQAEAFARTEEQREARLQSALLVLRGMADELNRREAVAVAEVEATVVDLALELARVVLDREIGAAKNPGAEALTRALALAPEGTPTTARLNPEDVALLGDLAVLSAGRDLVVVADGDVERGGCVVDTAGRRIDAQVGPALIRAREALR